MEQKDKSILIIAENETERLALKQSFVSSFNIFENNNFEEGLETLKAKKDEINAVIFVCSPSFDHDLECIKAYKEIQYTNQIPIIVIADQEGKGYKNEAYRLGANVFLTKPIDYTGLRFFVDNNIQLIDVVKDDFDDKNKTIVSEREKFFNQCKNKILSMPSSSFFFTCFVINDFKSINEKYGYRKGNQIIDYFYSTLKNNVLEENGICCRYEGTTFVALYPNVERAPESKAIAHDKLTNVPFLDIKLNLRVGRYLVNDLTIDTQTMFDRAMLASEYLKQHKEILLCDFDDSMIEDLVLRKDIIKNFDKAIEDREFEIWLQPQIDSFDNAVVSSEALVRWRKKDGTMIYPNIFIPVLEQNNLIYKLDQYVWEEACRLLRKWKEEGRQVLPISVNVSREDLIQKDFFDYVNGLLNKYQIDKNLLRLEVTESALIQDSDKIKDIVNGLIASGFIVDIDDFGSGYSSLAILKDVHAQYLKLDQRFFDSFGHDERAGKIVESVIRMARWLKITVIAEGVETKETVDFLISLGVHYIQGYYYSKPLPVVDYLKYVDSHQSKAEAETLSLYSKFDESTFWESSSLDTLVFNHFSGGAFILEKNKNKLEMVRVNEQFPKTIDSKLTSEQILKVEPFSQLDTDARQTIMKTIDKANKSYAVQSCIVYYNNPRNKDARGRFIKTHIRRIASIGQRSLFYGYIDDVTSEKEAIAESFEINQRLKIVTNNVPCGIVAASINDNNIKDVLLANDRFYELLGYKRNNFAYPKEKSFALVHPDDLGKYRDAIFNNVKVGRTRTVEIRVKHSSGKYIWLQVDIMPVRLNKHDELIQFACFTDVSKRKQVEEDEKKTQEWFYTILEKSYAGITASIIKDNGDIDIIFSNDAFYKLFGYSRESFNKKYANPIDILLDEDREKTMEKVWKTLKNKTTGILEYRCYKKDGSIVWIRCLNSVVKLSGSDDHVLLGQMIDITDLNKAKEEALKASEELNGVLNNLSSGVIVYQRDNETFTPLFSNEQYYRIFGISKSQQHRKNTTKGAHVHPNDLPIVRQGRDDVLNGDNEVVIEYRFINKNQKTIWIRQKTKKIVLPSINNDVFISIIDDITASRNLLISNQITIERFNLAINSQSNGICAMRINKESKPVIVFCNERFYELFGIKPQFLSKSMKPLSSLLNKEEARKNEQIIKQLRETHSSGTLTYWVNRIDGSRVCLKQYISFSFSPDSDELIETSIFTDVTQNEIDILLTEFINNMFLEVISKPYSEQAIMTVIEKTKNFYRADKGYVIEFDQDNIVTNVYENVDNKKATVGKSLNGKNIVFNGFWKNEIDHTKTMFINDPHLVVTEETVIKTLPKTVKSLLVCPVFNIKGEMIAILGFDNPKSEFASASKLRGPADFISILLNRRDTASKEKKENKEKQLLLNAIPGGYVRFKVDANNSFSPDFISINFLQMLGLGKMKTSDVTFDTLRQRVYGADRPHANFALQKAVNSSDLISHITHRFIKTDGTIVPVSAYGQVSYGIQGEKYLNIFYSSGEQEMKKESLENSLLDNLPCGALLCDFDGKRIKIKHINDYFLSLTGRNKEDINDKLGIGLVHPDDRNMINVELLSSIESGREANVDVRIVCKDGTYKPFHLAAKSIKEDNGHYSLYIYALPISDRAMSVQSFMPVALSSLMSYSKSLIFVIDNNQRFVSVSQPFAQLNGLSVKQLEGKKGSEIYHVVSDNVFEKNNQEVLNSTQPLLDSVETFADLDGKTHTINLSRYPLLDNNKEAIGLYAIGFEVDEQNNEKGSIINSGDNYFVEENKKMQHLFKQSRIAMSHSNRTSCSFDIKTRTLTVLPYQDNRIHIPNVITNLPDTSINDGSIAEQSKQAYIHFFNQIINGEADEATTIVRKKINNKWLWVEIKGSILKGENNENDSAIISYLDITDRLEKEAIYTKWKQKIANLDERLYSLIRVNVTKKGIRESIEGSLLNEAIVNRGTGSFAYRVNAFVENAVHEEDKKRYLQFVNLERLSALHQAGVTQEEAQFRIKIRDEYHFVSLFVELVQYTVSNDVEAFFTFTDIDKEKQEHENLIQLSLTDPLTKLMNRVAHKDEVDNYLLNQTNKKQKNAFFMIDIDSFKMVNDTHGHVTGDDVLIAVSQKLKSFTRASDYLARLGGDEFVIFLKDVKNQEDVANKAKQLLTLIDSEKIYGCSLSISIGVALSPSDGHCWDELYANADIALYQAKENGKNRFYFYHKDLK